MVELVSEYNPSGDQPQAIEQLAKEIEEKENYLIMMEDHQTSSIIGKNNAERICIENVKKELFLNIAQQKTRLKKLLVKMIFKSTLVLELEM